MKRPRTRPAVRLLAKAIVLLGTHTTVSGRENLPAGGPLLVVFNHLGHMDAAVFISSLPFDVEAIALSDLFAVPVTGQMLQLYGVISVKRDMVDRSVVDQSLAVLKAGGVLALAPEARMSVTGALEKARGGAAYLALKAGVPILPLALTGTENKHVYGEWKHLHRPRVSMTIGPVFRLPDLPLEGAERRKSVEQASTTIMTHIAAMLPPAYRGVYAGAVQPTADPDEQAGAPAVSKTNE